jgi:hypothetical protein
MHPAAITHYAAMRMAEVLIESERERRLAQTAQQPPQPVATNVRPQLPRLGRWLRAIARRHEPEAVHP